jgi:hypothetical protein
MGTAANAMVKCYRWRQLGCTWMSFTAVGLQDTLRQIDGVASDGDAGPATQARGDSPSRAVG